jgi:surface polysaccharide O-acyltransferase-like enzyme
MDPALSDKLRLLTFFSLSMVVLRHAYNLRLGFADESAPAADRAVEFVETFLSHELTWVVIPLFFSMSGYLFFRGLVPTWQGLLTKWRSRVRSLLVPYLLWCAWGIVLYIVLQNLPGAGPYFVNNRVEGIPVGYVLDRMFVHPVPYQLWFLQALMGCVVLAGLLIWPLRHVGWWTLAPLALLWLLSADLLPYLRSSALLFFAFGGLMAMRATPRPRVPRWLALALPPVWLVALALLFALDGGTPDTSGWYDMAHRLMMLPGLAALWYGYDVYVPRLSHAGRVWWLSAFGFFVFAFHEPPLFIIKKLLFRVFGHSAAADLAIYVIAPVAVVTLAVTVGAAMRRHTPRVYALLTGGR